MLMARRVNLIVTQGRKPPPEGSWPRGARTNTPDKACANRRGRSNAIQCLYAEYHRQQLLKCPGVRWLRDELALPPETASVT
jgi:hypothetical protein